MDQERAVTWASPVDELLFKLLKPVKVLVAENGDEAAMTADRLQKRFDCIVEWAATAQETLKKATTCGYDILVVDLAMPGVLTVLSAIKSQMPRMPLLLVVSAEAIHLVEQAAALGPVLIAHKPVLDFRSVFEAFRMRVREKEDAAYFDRRQRQATVSCSV